MLPRQAAIAAHRDLCEARHALDVEMEQIAGDGIFIAHPPAAGDSDRASGSAGRGAGCG